MEAAIIQASKQISAEACEVLYGQAVLHLSCDQSLRTPFPTAPLREIERLKERDKLFAQVLRRIKKIRLRVLVAALGDHDPDLRDLQYFGHNYGYSPNEMREGTKDLKEVLAD